MSSLFEEEPKQLDLGLYLYKCCNHCVEPHVDDSGNEGHEEACMCSKGRSYVKYSNQKTIPLFDLETKAS